MGDAIQQIHKIADRLPTVVLQDIHQRIGDWLSSGGDPDADYVYQQLRYAQRFVNNEN